MMAEISDEQRDVYIPKKNFNSLYGTMMKYMEGARYRLATSPDKNGNFLQLTVAPGQKPEDVAQALDASMANRRYVVIPERMITPNHCWDFYMIAERHKLTAWLKTADWYGIVMLQGSDKYALLAAEQAIWKLVKEVCPQSYTYMFMPNRYRDIMRPLALFLEETENIMINKANVEATWDGILYKMEGEITKVRLTAQIINMATEESFDSLHLKHIPAMGGLTDVLAHIRDQSGARIELQLRAPLRKLLADNKLYTNDDEFKTVEAERRYLVTSSLIYITGTPESRWKAKQFITPRMFNFVCVDDYVSENDVKEDNSHWVQLKIQHQEHYISR